MRGAPSPSLFPPSLRSFEFVPAPDGVAENLLILLHGRGCVLRREARGPRRV